MGQVFDFDLPSTTLDGYNAVVGVNWLPRNHANIPGEEETLCGESAIVLKHQSSSIVSAISAVKARSVYRGITPLC